MALANQRKAGTKHAPSLSVGPSPHMDDETVGWFVPKSSSECNIPYSFRAV